MYTSLISIGNYLGKWGGFNQGSYTAEHNELELLVGMVWPHGKLKLFRF